LREIVTNNDLLDTLVHFGLSSSLDIWVLAFGHHLKIDAVFTESLKQVGEEVAGKWQAGKAVDFLTSIEAISETKWYWLYHL
jgi:hypothetical protein